MKSFGSKPWMLPQPVLIIGTYDKDGKPNAMNAAWGGQWDMHEIINILCDERYLGEDGNPDVEQMDLITYDPVHHTYIRLGETEGKAFSDGKPEQAKSKDIYLAGGCFWGTEHYFKQIEGVVETSVGFANGHTENPTYKEVYTDATGYAETVHVKYNPDMVSLEFLLQMFFKAIDPTSLNKQGHDEGTRYRTGIYYTDDEDLPVIDKVFSEVQKEYQEPLAVEKLPLKNYYTAEEYHQDYLDKNPTGYCHLPVSLFEFARQAKEKK